MTFGELRSGRSTHRSPSVERYIENNVILVQHQDSQTNWFFPSRDLDDVFSRHRVGFDGLKAWLLA